MIAVLASVSILAGNGVDISMLPALEARGALYRTAAGEPADAIQILRDNGCANFRVRLFVDPTDDFDSSWGAVQNLEMVRSLCRRIDAAGGAILLDLHYSDTWADPGRQTTPAAWATLDFDSLVTQVHAYTADVLAALREDGVVPAAVQIGNEIAPGLLWPMGRIVGPAGSAEQLASLDRVAAILNAGSRAVREASTPEKPIRVVLHTHGGGTAELRWFFIEMNRRKVDFDIAAVSFYPECSESIDLLRENVAFLIRELDKDVMIAEVGYPHADRSPWIRDATHMRWPQTPEGQAAFVDELNALVRAAPDGRCLGWWWWYPEAVPIDGHRIYHDGRSALFDSTGRPLPAMSRIGNPRP